MLLLFQKGSLYICNYGIFVFPKTGGRVLIITVFCIFGFCNAKFPTHREKQGYKYNSISECFALLLKRKNVFNYHASEPERHCLIT